MNGQKKSNYRGNKITFLFTMDYSLPLSLVCNFLDRQNTAMTKTNKALKVTIAKLRADLLAKDHTHMQQINRTRVHYQEQLRLMRDQLRTSERRTTVNAHQVQYIRTLQRRLRRMTRHNTRLEQLNYQRIAQLRDQDRLHTDDPSSDDSETEMEDWSSEDLLEQVVDEMMS